MSTFWCVNFDGQAGLFGHRSHDYVLQHGLQEQAWLLHYQYSNDGYAYQGNEKQLAATTKNWKEAAKILPDDWLIAYLPPKRVYGIGRVVRRRDRLRHTSYQQHQDTIKRTTETRTHLHLNGIVDYTDAGALYEDFTDTWGLPLVNPYSQRPEFWRYPQRIDVERWLHTVPEGIQVEGPWSKVPPHKIQLSVFQIPEAFFQTIRTNLQGASQT